MRRRFVFLVASLAFTGCQPAEEETTSALPTAGDLAEASGAASPPELAGEYRVAGVNSQDIDLPHGISATVDETMIRVSADCLNIAWNYRLEGARLITEPVPVASCRRSLLPPEEAVRAAFDAAETVRRTPANGLEFSGGGRSVTLFSQ